MQQTHNIHCLHTQHCTHVCSWSWQITVQTNIMLMFSLQKWLMVWSLHSSCQHWTFSLEFFLQGHYLGVEKTSAESKCTGIAWYWLCWYGSCCGCQMQHCKHHIAHHQQVVAPRCLATTISHLQQIAYNSYWWSAVSSFVQVCKTRVSLDWQQLSRDYRWL